MNFQVNRLLFLLCLLKDKILAQRLLTCDGEVTENFEKDLTERIFYTAVVLWSEEMECFWGDERFEFSELQAIIRQF